MSANALTHLQAQANTLLVRQSNMSGLSFAYSNFVMFGKSALRVAHEPTPDVGRQRPTLYILRPLLLLTPNCFTLDPADLSPVQACTA